MEEDKPDSSDTKKNLEQLTSLADQMLSTGIVDVYEYTYEKIKYTLEESEREAGSI